MPYAEYGLSYDFQIIVQTSQGLRPSIPNGTPLQLKTFFENLVDHDASKRPTATEAAKKIAGFQASYRKDPKGFLAQLYEKPLDEKKAPAAEEKKAGGGFTGWGKKEEKKEEGGGFSGWGKKEEPEKEKEKEGGFKGSSLFFFPFFFLHSSSLISFSHSAGWGKQSGSSEDEDSPTTEVNEAKRSKRSMSREKSKGEKRVHPFCPLSPFSLSPLFTDQQQRNRSSGTSRRELKKLPEAARRSRVQL